MSQLSSSGKTPRQSRRRFLQHLAISTLGGSLLATQSKLKLLNAALAATPINQINDYKSLVCVFLYGGNDSFNLIVPNTSSSYQHYATIRQSLAVPQNQLIALNGIPYGMHSAGSELASLYQSGKLAILANTGNLKEPVTRAQIHNESALLPPELFSHNDQQEFSQTCLSPATGTSNPGWGGRMADLLQDANGSSPLPPGYALNGTNLWQAGLQSNPISVSAWGGIPHFHYLDDNSWIPWSSSRRNTWLNSLDQSSSHILMQQLATDTHRTRDLMAVLSEAMDSAPSINTAFNSQNYLAQQLQTVAKLISIRQQLGLKRQIFLVGMGGFDTHGAQNSSQPTLFSALSNALNSFYQATVELGVSQSVTTFTTSEFGRTLTSNGDGTDHAWGAHQMILGGAVAGGHAYGSFPDLSLDGPDDMFDDGRIIPTTSTDQYAATLGKWMGLSESNLLDVLPNLHRFSKRDLGFLDFKDADNDGVPDAADNCPSASNANQNNYDGDGSGDVCDPDDDNDGMRDNWEIKHGLNPKNAGDRNQDADGDGFSNYEEYKFGSNPRIIDTDLNHNGVPDAVDRKRAAMPAIHSLLLDD